MPIIKSAKKAARQAVKRTEHNQEIKKAIKEVDIAIENLWKGIEQGQAVDMLTERLNRRQAEKAELEAQLAIENNKKICLTEAQIYAFLDFICEMPMDDINKRRALINIFVHSVYLYDDHFIITFNYKNTSKKVSPKEINSSSLTSSPPPKKPLAFLQVVFSFC